MILDYEYNHCNKALIKANTSYLDACTEYCFGFFLMLTKRDVRQIRIPTIFWNISLFDLFQRNILEAPLIIFLIILF